MLRAWHGLLLAASIFATTIWSCDEELDPSPRPELTGEVGGGGFGGVPVATMAASGGGGQAGSGGSGGGACLDPNEPNESESAAVDLGTFGDCDDVGAGVEGALDGATDSDWYRYTGDDSGACAVDPIRMLVADGPLRLCKFAECASGTASVSCLDGAVAESSPEGREGCCHDGGFGMEVDCAGMNDSAAIYLRLDQAAACVPYQVSFHY